jgi:hypothetical protein
MECRWITLAHRKAAGSVEPEQESEGRHANVRRAYAGLVEIQRPDELSALLILGPKVQRTVIGEVARGKRGPSFEARTLTEAE